MRIPSTGQSFARGRTTITIASVLALVLATLVAVGTTSSPAQAQGPPYDGPETAATGPAYFGPAPNPVPYCESPTYFDPFPENVNPIGSIDPGGGPDASVTTDGITMWFEVTGEGDPGGQYPGFFPFGGEGAPNDQPKGVEMAADDAATVTLSQPLFYSQWVFTDVDRDNEGFFVTPTWTAPGEVAVFAGDADFDFTGTNSNLAAFNDTDTDPTDSQSIEGRVQVDFLGAVTGISMVRDTGEGQSGFAVGGGCEATGVAKTVVSGPTWNGSSFDVTYELRLRNNLPSGPTVSQALVAAQAAAPADVLSAPPSGITLDNIEFNESLADSNFVAIDVIDVSNPGGSLALNPDFDGLGQTNLLAPGASVEAETNELVVVQVQYTPDLASPFGAECVAGYEYSNQATVSATAANVAVSDISDDGVDPAPGADNGNGGLDDPTIVIFPCPPAGLDIVKTAVPGPSGTCPTFDGGIAGDGPALQVTDGDTVTYCISVRNPATSAATSVTVSDPQNPDGDIFIGTIGGGFERTVSFDVDVTLATPTLNTASAAGNGPDGVLPIVTDTAVISVAPLPSPSLSIVKTALTGPGATCPDYFGGTQGVGPALNLAEGDVVTYCISILNSGPGDATNVVIGDPQAGGAFDGVVGNLASGATADRTFDLTVTLATPSLNTATVTGDGPYGAVPSDSDDALIDVVALPDPRLQIVKTVVPGPNGACPAFADGVVGAGAALPVLFGETVTYCITVENSSGSAATNVVISDPQAPGDFDGNVGTLAVGAEVTRTFDLVVDAATPALNTATVNGSGPNGPVAPDTDQAVINTSPQPDPRLQIVKTVVPGPDGACPLFADGVQGAGTPLPVRFGETVTYCITVENTSGSDATGVLVTDAQAPAGFDGAIGALAVGEEATVAFDLVIDAATPQLNTAFVGGSGPNGPVAPDSDDAVINSAPQPDPVLQIVKTVVPGPQGVCPDFAGGEQGLGTTLPVLYGDTVTYCLSARNIGGTSATDVVVSDPQAPAGFDGSLGFLAVGVEESMQFDLVVGAATPEINTARVDGNGPNGALPGDSDQARIDASAQPDPILEIVKTVVRGPGGACPDFEEGVPNVGPALPVVFGQTVTYCISVLNSGPRDATNVTIFDPQASANFDGNVGVLTAGAEATRSFDLVVDVGTPSINQATVSGQGPNGPLPNASDTARISSGLAPDPVLDIVKTVVPGPDGDCPAFADGEFGIGQALEVFFGSTVTYCVSITNLGDSPATDVVISDPQAPADFDGSIATLASDQFIDRSYDIVVTVDTPTINTATVSGFGPNGAVPGDSDPARIAPEFEPDPILDIVKTVVAGPVGDCPAFADGIEGVGPALPVLYGDTVTYCLSVANVGQSTATGVAVTDPQAPVGFDGSIGDLGVDQVVTLSFDLVVDAATPEVNTARVDGNGPNGALPSDDDLARIESEPQPDPQLDIVKTVVPGPNGACPSFDDGVVGIGVGLDVIIGDTVTYCLSVRNVGAGDATNVVINDPQADAPIDIGSLVSGATFDESYDVTVNETTPLINTAVVSGQGPNGTLDPADDSAQIVSGQQLIPSITLTNTVVGPTTSCDDAVESVDEFILGSEGDPVRWCFEITNTGNTSLTQIVFDDAPLGFADLDILAVHGNGGLSLPPGASIVFSSDGTIPESGLESLASVVALASEADGTPIPDLAPVGDSNDALVAEAAVALAKSVVAGDAGDCSQGVDAIAVNAGETVTWCFAITNTGAVDLVVEEVVDATLNVRVPVPEAQQRIAPGATVTVSTSGPVTEDIDNVATVTGIPVDPNGEPYPDPPLIDDDDEASVDALWADLAIIKTVDNPGPAVPGTGLTYTLTITNDGPDAAAGVMVSDSLPEGLSYEALPDDDDWACALRADDPQAFDCAKATPLASGVSVELTYTAVIDDDAALTTTYINTSTVTSDTPDPDDTDNSDDASTSTATPVVPPVVPPTNPPPEYPGPFDPPEQEEPDEVQGLVITGSSSPVLVMASMMMLMLGGVLHVGARRGRDELLVIDD